MLILSHSVVVRFMFSQSSPEEVYAAIKNLKKESPRFDIYFGFIKMCGMCLTTLLCDSLNMYFREATNTDKFKYFKITPLLQKGVRNCIENHGSVAIICNMSKVFDSLIH